MGEFSRRLPYRRAIGALALTLALGLAGCSAGAVSTQVSTISGTGVAVATQVGPTAAVLATSAANAGGTAGPGVQQTAAAIATGAPGAIGTAISGAGPTAAAVATNAGGAFATAGAVATTLPGNVPLRTGKFVRKTQDGAGGVEVIATPGGTAWCGSHRISASAAAAPSRST